MILRFSHTIPVTAGLLVGILTLDAVWGADAASQAAAIAERQEMRESIHSLSAKVDDMWTAQSTQQRRLTQLAEEVARSRMDQEKGGSKFATKEELLKLAESIKQAIRELDEKRLADRKLILEEIKKLEKLPTVIHAPTPVVPEPKKNANEASKAGAGDNGDSGPREGYEYEIKKGDTISTILQAYNEEFKKVGKKTLSTKQVLDLEENKKINPNALRVGQKLFIPDPPKK